MADKIRAKFINNSSNWTRIVIFEVTKEDTSGKETGKVVFVGGIPDHGYTIIELDSTIRPWAAIPNQNYKIGDTFDFNEINNPINLRQFDGNSYGWGNGD